MKLKTITLAAAMIAMASTAMAETQGVTDNKIIVGSHSDLSGPLAIGGVPATNGLKMRFDEVNAAGGIHGRMIEFLVEDAQYQVPLAVRATNKLVKKDKIFAMIMGTGTPQNLAAMTVLDKAGIPNLFPLTGAGSMYKPLHPTHFSIYVSYQDQAAGALSYFHRKMAVKNICIQSVASDYGQEIVEGVKETAKKLGINISLHGTHKVTETDFAGAATAIKNSGCELLMLGTTIKDTITLYGTLRKLGWDKPIVGNMVPYLQLIAEAGNGVTEGLYLVSPYRIADFEDGDEWRAKFLATYKKRFGKHPNVFAQAGYIAGDLFVKAVEAVGANLTVESLIAAIENIQNYQDPFGGPKLSFSASKHGGGDALVLVQNQSKVWIILEDDLPY